MVSRARSATTKKEIQIFIIILLHIIKKIIIFVNISIKFNYFFLIYLVYIYYYLKKNIQYKLQISKYIQLSYVYSK